MTQQQREAIDGMLRASPFNLAGDLREQRTVFEAMMTASPVPGDVVTTPGELGGVPVITVDIPGVTTGGVILYFHGGFFAIGRAGLPQPTSAVLMSPLADLAGTGESMTAKADVDPVLSADAVRVRARDYLGSASASDPAVSPIYGSTLDVTPGVPHVFQAFAAVLDEGADALTRAGDFLRAHVGTAVAATAGRQG